MIFLSLSLRLMWMNGLEPLEEAVSRQQLSRWKLSVGPMGPRKKIRAQPPWPVPSFLYPPHGCNKDSPVSFTWIFSSNLSLKNLYKLSIYNSNLSEPFFDLFFFYFPLFNWLSSLFKLNKANSESILFDSSFLIFNKSFSIILAYYFIVFFLSEETGSTKDLTRFKLYLSFDW